jgi:hypothetical protein
MFNVGSNPLYMTLGGMRIVVVGLDFSIVASVTPVENSKKIFLILFFFCHSI